MNNLTANPFQAPSQTVTGGNAMVEQESQRAIAETQAAIMLAKRFPRDQAAAYERIMRACERPALAETAVYTYARGGADVSGASIRLAESIAQNWGNIQYGIRELEQRNGESTVEAFAWDVETNTRQVKVFQVPHVRYSKSKGNTKLTDPRDIYELVANNGARRLRACILGVIPSDVIEAATHQCQKTLAASADITPEGIKRLIESFESIGVTQKMIEQRIQRKIEAITPANIVNLKGVYRSIRDGMSSAQDQFEVIAEQKKPDTLTARSFDKPEGTTTPLEMVDPQTGELI